MKRTCKQCGAQFELSQDEIAFYQRKNLQLPKRCEQCRRENKAKMGGGSVQQAVTPYRGGKNNGIKRRMVAAAVLVLLFVGIGVFYARQKSGQQAYFQADAVQNAQIEQTAVAADDTEITEVSPQAESSPEELATDLEEEPAAEQQPEILEETDRIAENAPQEKPAEAQISAPAPAYSFRREAYLQEHFASHGAEFGYSSAEEYLAGANRVVASPEALHKLEAEDGDDVFYLEASNEFVIVSTDGYIRTYFKPEDGKAYFDRQ